MEEQPAKPIQRVRQPFSKETIDSLKDLGEVLMRIHRRLISEGYIIKDGKIYKPNEQLNEKY